MDRLRLEGKVALVTGSGRGLGRAMAEALAEAGADLLVTARSEREIKGTEASIRALGRKAVAVPCDVTDKASIDKMVDVGLRELGRIDILVNNAGTAIIKPLLELKEEEWHRTLDTNLTSMFLCCKAVGPVMIRQGGGTIINMTSVLGARGRTGSVAYACSKGGVIQLTRTLAIEWAPYNIRVNAIGPGAFYTRPMKFVLDDPKLGEIRRKKIPLKREGQPDELGPLVVYLASPASGYMTGQIIYVDGGELAKL
ncbi:MAG: SDR family oxidoreductase [Deltaproteobacteria bacterium]|nr:SDR family oxidoreductase [Deltaproteobacteria bacterium]MBW2139187.1 SDR family oxidoreductase [Deltaproteobacteria bacterium]